MGVGMGISEWTVDSDRNMMTDHKPVRFICKVENDREITLGRHYRKASWDKFTLHLKGLNLDSLEDQEPSVEGLARSIGGNLKEALDWVAKKKERKASSLGSWWTMELENKRKELKKMD